MDDFLSFAVSQDQIASSHKVDSCFAYETSNIMILCVISRVLFHFSSVDQHKNANSLSSPTPIDCSVREMYTFLWFNIYMRTEYQKTWIKNCIKLEITVTNVQIQTENNAKSAGEVLTGSQRMSCRSFLCHVTTVLTSAWLLNCKLTN